VISTESEVFVVDDDQSLREALSSLIRSIGIRVETFATADDFLRHKRRNIPACLVLDVRLPGLSGLELQRELAAAGELLPIIFITGHGDIPMTVRAMKAGAIEFLPKPFREQDLLDAIWQALDQAEAALQRRAGLAALHLNFGTLTAREREVTDMIVRGMLNKQIAAKLKLSEITVKVHRRRIMEKMNATSLAELVRIVGRLSNSDLMGGTAIPKCNGP